MCLRLPNSLQEQVSDFREVHDGLHRITVEVADGRVYSGVEVAWAEEIIRLAGHVGAFRGRRHRSGLEESDLDR